MPGRISWASLAALLLAAISVAATLSVIDFPIGTLGDEYAKLEAIRTGRYNYFHPLLMIDLVQAATPLVQPPDLQSLAELGRLFSALAGGLLVFGTFSLARLVLPDVPALAAAAATAATPLVSVHARILKEDIFVAAFLVLALAALIRLLRDPAPHRAVLLGILAGLAGGAKYIGQLMVPFAIVAIMVVPTPGPRRGLRAALVAAVSVGTYLLVMLPAIRRLHRWQRGMKFELTHAMYGHDVPLPPQLTWGVFHLRESLWPGLGAPLLVLGLVGLAAPLVAAPERRMPLCLIMAFAVLWYGVHEVSPLKPYPDFAHYMLPLVPLLVILATSFIYEVLSRRDPLGIAAAVVIAVAAIPALWISIRTNTPDQDPRAVVRPILVATGARIATDRYADYITSRKLLGEIPLQPTAATTDIVATANLVYDRFKNYAARKDKVSLRAARYYRELNALPHLDVSNGRPTFAYFNPALRIVAMDGSVERLKQIAAAIKAAAPGFKVKLIEPKPAD